MSDGYKYQLNLKFGEQYKETLFNIQGDSQEEFQQNVAWAVDNVDGIVGAAVAYGVAYNIKKPQDNPPPAPAQQRGSWSNAGSQQSSQPAANTAQSGPAPTCRHGEMKFVPGGVSARTKRPYDAFWSCNGPRNEQCDTVKA